MKPRLKINGIDNLHDARYCAAVGILLLEFQMSPQADHAVDAPMIKEVEPWLSGPEVAARFIYETPDEIKALLDGAPVRYISLPGDYHPGLLDDVEGALILRAEGAEQAAGLAAQNPEALIELSPGEDFAWLAEQNWLDRAILRIEDPGKAYEFLRKQGKQPFAFTLGEFFMEASGEIDYDRCDDFIEQYHQVSL